MRLSVFYDHILQAHGQLGKSIPEILQYCRSLGIDAVEMEYTLFSENRTTIYPMLSRAGLSISCFYEFFNFHNDSDLSGAEKMLETASELEVSRVLFVPGALGEQEAAELSACSGIYEAVADFMDNSLSIRNMQQALVRLTAYAASLGVTVTLEDFDGFTQPFSKMNQLLWFMKNVPGLRCTLDMGNFAFSDEDVVRAADLLKDYIVHVHCKDRGLNPAVQGAFCKGLGQSPAGCGYIPIQPLVYTLRERGYDGYLAIEHFDVPDQLIFIRKSADFLRKCAGITAINGCGY